MDEEQISELTRLAEEAADEYFNTSVDGIDTETDDAIVSTFIQAANNTPDIPVTGVTTELARESTVDTESTDTEEEEEEEERDFIAPNITTSVADEATARFSSAEWFEKMKEQHIIMAGLGGIGSWCSLLLGRCHPHTIELFDGDIVESVNMAGQLYSLEQVGAYKSSVCVGMLELFCDYRSILQYGRYDENEHPTSNIMVCGFDNMEARKYFYSQWKQHVINTSHPENCLFIDARLNAEEWQIFAIRGTDDYRMREYQSKWLFDDKEVEEALCSYKQTSFCASMVASYMVNIFVNFVANLCNPIIERDIPFLTEFDAKNIYLKTVQ